MADLDPIYGSLGEAEKILRMFMQSEAVAKIDEAAGMIVDSLNAGGKIISCGNGGSLCDATHFAEELTGRYRSDRRPYAAIAINDPAYITCVGNDYSFGEIFSRFVKGVGNAGDILLAISTSGNSINIVEAARMAKEIGMKVISLTSIGTNKLAEHADLVLATPGSDFPDRIQEMHIKIIHLLIQSIEAKLECD